MAYPTRCWQNASRTPCTQVLQDTLAASISDSEERRWVQRGTFSEFTYWKHDEVPTQADALAKCLEWAQIASVLHGHHEASDDLGT